MTMRLVSMPISRAASRSLATARMALPSERPVEEQVEDHHDGAATPTIQSAWGTNVAPSTGIGRSPVKAGSPAAFLPSETMTPPLIRIEAPIVTMMTFSTSRVRDRPDDQPLHQDAHRGHRGDRDDDDQRERQARRREDRRAEHAAEHGELALGEVHRARRVEDDIEPERDEPVDRPHHEPREEELEQVRGGHAPLTRARWGSCDGPRAGPGRGAGAGAGYDNGHIVGVGERSCQFWVRLARSGDFHAVR